jgi:hypothetical protein
MRIRTHEPAIVRHARREAPCLHGWYARWHLAGGTSRVGPIAGLEETIAFSVGCSMGSF